MTNKNLTYKSIPGFGLMNKTACELRLEFFKSLSDNADYLTSSKLTLDDVQHNIESFIGAVEHPLAIAGPLLFNAGEDTAEWLYTGICTSEGALVASVNRGAKAISECGGFSAHFAHQKMIRTPIFVFQNMKSAVKFETWVKTNFKLIKQTAEKYSNHAELLEINSFITGKFVHLRFVYSTGDASGQNMVTHCTWHTCLWIEKQFQEEEKITIEYFHIEGGGAGDKKVSFNNLLNGRGISVTGECFLTHEVIEKTLRANANDIYKFYRNSTSISRIDGIVGNSINIANAIAGIFAATGQDLASIHESAIGIAELEKTENGLYYSLSIPTLVIGTVGGGTQLPGPKKVLEFMNCAGEGKLERFAKLIVGFAMALEISTGAAIASGQFADAHQKRGKNKPTASGQAVI